MEMNNTVNHFEAIVMSIESSCHMVLFAIIKASGCF